MDKFLMICYVAADFRGPDGQMFRVTPERLGTFIETPVWVKGTLLFKMLMNDGSIKIALESEKKELENDPMKGIGADGKETEEKPEEVDTKLLKTRKAPAKKKKDDA